MKLVKELCGCKPTAPRLDILHLAWLLVFHTTMARTLVLRQRQGYVTYFTPAYTRPPQAQRRHTRLTYCLSTVITLTLAFSLMYLVLWLVQHLVK